MYFVTLFSLCMSQEKTVHSNSYKTMLMKLQCIKCNLYENISTKERGGNIAILEKSFYVLQNWY